jgi:hypothetical protein
VLHEFDCQDFPHWEGLGRKKVAIVEALFGRLSQPERQRIARLYSSTADGPTS